MNRGIFFVLAGVGIAALLVILGWMELNREATDAQLVKAAMDQVRPSSSPSRVPLQLVSSKVKRMSRDRGVIHVTFSMPRQVDRRVGDRDVIEAVYEQASPDHIDGPILHPPRLKPTGTLTVTLSCEFAIQRESLPFAPWLGALKARSVVLWPDFSEPEAERQFIDQLKDMVDKGEMDNAVHDLLRIRKTYYLPTPRDYYRIRHGLPPDYREIDLFVPRQGGDLSARLDPSHARPEGLARRGRLIVAWPGCDSAVRGRSARVLSHPFCVGKERAADVRRRAVRRV